MTLRSVLAALAAVVLAVSAVELSTWVLGRAVSAIVPAAPSASVSDIGPETPHASEVDAPVPAVAPALTW